jgi:lysophospholipase L1-like esterase
MKKNLLFSLLAFTMVTFIIFTIIISIIFIDLKNAKNRGESGKKIFIENKIISRIFYDKNWSRVITELSKRRGGSFSTTWNYNGNILLSKSLHKTESMYGKEKYTILPNISVSNMRIWTGTYYQRLITNVDKNLLSILKDCTIITDVVYNTDLNGFKITYDTGLNPKLTLFVLGDSFTEGLWVKSDETFSSIFTKNIHRNIKIPIKTYNLGVRGYSVLESSFLFDKYYQKLNPDMVILNLFINDVDENYYNVMINKDIDENAYREMFFYIKNISDNCKKNDITFFVSIIPAKGQLNSEVELFFQNNVMNWSRKEGIKTFNPYQYFKDVGFENIYFPWDPHFSADGHSHYANFLEKNIIKTLKERINENQ